MAEGFVLTPDTGTKKLHTNHRTIGADDQHDEYVLVSEPAYATYTVTTTAGGISTATATSHLLEIMAGGSLNVVLRRLTVTQIVPATTAAFMELQLFRLTTAGTGGGVLTPRLSNTNDAVAGATAMTLPTVKGTEGALYWSEACVMAQAPAATFAPPAKLVDWDFDKLLRGKPPVILAGGANGFALKNVAAHAAGFVVITAIITELAFAP